jgi:hypothetical protein
MSLVLFVAVDASLVTKVSEGHFGFGRKGGSDKRTTGRELQLWERKCNHSIWYPGIHEACNRGWGEVGMPTFLRSSLEKRVFISNGFEMRWAWSRHFNRMVCEKRCNILQRSIGMRQSLRKKRRALGWLKKYLFLISHFYEKN